MRDYGVHDQLGLEKTPEEYIAKMVAVFREVKRVLKPEGTLWLNLGDSYCGGNRGAGMKHEDFSEKQKSNAGSLVAPSPIPQGMKAKDLVGIPWMLAFALRADGWYLRQDIIWHKPNPMPESVKDRCTKAHEYIFLMSKQPKYYCDMEAIREKNANPTRTNYTCGSRPNGENKDRNDNDMAERSKDFEVNGRNKRSVFSCPSQFSKMRDDLSEEKKKTLVAELLKRGII